MVGDYSNVVKYKKTTKICCNGSHELAIPDNSQDHNVQFKVKQPCVSGQVKPALGIVEGTALRLRISRYCGALPRNRPAVVGV